MTYTPSKRGQLDRLEKKDDRYGSLLICHAILGNVRRASYWAGQSVKACEKIQKLRQQ